MELVMIGRNYTSADPVAKAAIPDAGRSDARGERIGASRCSSSVNNSLHQHILTNSVN